MATRSGRRTRSRYASTGGANQTQNATNELPPVAPAPTPAATTRRHQNIQRELDQQEATPEARPMSFDKGSVFDKFLKTSPPKFDGKADPAEAEKWIRRIKKIFARLKCTDEQKVSMATYMLEGPAEDWWDMVERQYQGRENELS